MKKKPFKKQLKRKGKKEHEKDSQDCIFFAEESEFYELVWRIWVG